MAKNIWTFALDGKPHRVELDHGFWSSRHRVLLDGECLFDKKVMLEFGAEVRFELDGHECIVHIDVPGRLAYAYALRIDGKPVPQSRNSTDTLLRPLEEDISSVVDRSITRSFAMSLLRDASRRRRVSCIELDNLVRGAGELTLDSGAKLIYMEENYHLIGPSESVTRYFGAPG